QRTRLSNHILIANALYAGTPTLAVSLNPDDNPRCKDCDSFDLDPEFFSVFKICVCRGCKQELADKYSLLTKTEVKEDYLLTDGKLYGENVEAFAFRKWGGPEGLDAEWERRESGKKQKRELKFKRKLADLRRRTRTTEYKKLRVNDVKHEHVFGEPEEDLETGETTQRCRKCAMIISVDEF
ncbi:hypothetical protein THASP1DRAFT_30358, partial [Thamnocephalis sphaerospora]